MGIVAEVLEIAEERPDTDEAEPGIDEIELGVTDGRLDEETPKVTEPEEPDEDTTKPDGIRLREDEGSDAADVVPNKSPVPEDVQAETCVVTTIVGVTTAEPILAHFVVSLIDQTYLGLRHLAKTKQTRPNTRQWFSSPNSRERTSTTVRVGGSQETFVQIKQW